MECLDERVTKNSERIDKLEERMEGVQAEIKDLDAWKADDILLAQPIKSAMSEMKTLSKIASGCSKCLLKEAGWNTSEYDKRKRRGLHCGATTCSSEDFFRLVNLQA